MPQLQKTFTLLPRAKKYDFALCKKITLLPSAKITFSSQFKIKFCFSPGSKLRFYTSLLFYTHFKITFLPPVKIYVFAVTTGTKPVISVHFNYYLMTAIMCLNVNIAWLHIIQVNSCTFYTTRIALCINKSVASEILVNSPVRHIVSIILQKAVRQ